MQQYFLSFLEVVFNSRRGDVVLVFVSFCENLENVIRVFDGYDKSKDAALESSLNYKNS